MLLHDFVTPGQQCLGVVLGGVIVGEVLEGEKIWMQLEVFRDFFDEQGVIAEVLECLLGFLLAHALFWFVVVGDPVEKVE